VYFNIFLDPMYVDPGNHDFHLQVGSPCIDAGDPESPLDPDGTVADIGAFFFDHNVRVTEPEPAVNPSSWSLSPAYPNPFNPTTTISVSIPQPAELNVSVFNIAGQQVATLASGTHSAGSHTLTFDAFNLAGGVYFVRATVRDTRFDVTSRAISQVQKIVLVK
jgi:hypothetical protein